MFELSVAPCKEELLPDSADCSGCNATIALVDCTVGSAADCEGCVAMIPLGGCLLCSLGSTNCCFLRGLEECFRSTDLFCNRAL